MPATTMHLVDLNLDSIPLGRPLPFVLRGADGALLAQKGYVIRNRDELNVIVSRGLRLCVDTDESGDSHRSYMAQLNQMLMAESSLGEIATMQMSADARAGNDRPDDGPPDWPELQLRATQLLRSPPPDFTTRFQALHGELSRHMREAPDATLLALVYLSATETHLYSATHAMLVTCVCTVVARQTLGWSEIRVRQLGHAALSMNISMTLLQDQLAEQAGPLTATQIAAVESHAHRSVALLRELGVADPVWLDAVRCHHHHKPGPLATRTDGEALGRLIQRADVFGARLAPRVSRSPMAVTAAMQAVYHDEEQRVDEAGAALVRTLGIYPPGAFVKLASQEVGIVLRRGSSATTPRVAVLLNRNGMPTGEPIPRDTSQAAYKITGPVAHKDVRVQVQLARLLPLV